MAGRCDSVFAALLFLLSLVTVFAQESINVGEGINLGMHAGLALLISYAILATCAIGVNIITRRCAKPQNFRVSD